MINQFEVSDNIGNYYGTLEVKCDSSKYFWAIENYNGYDWEEIPKSLYDELLKFKETKSAN